MNTDFKIVKEEIFDLAAESICLMLIRDGNKYRIQITNRTKRLGDKMSKDEKEAKALFDLLKKGIEKHAYTLEAELFLKKLLSLKDIDQVFFFLTVYKTKLSEAAIGKLVKKFKLNVKAKYGFLRAERKKNAITIKVRFGDDRKLFGEFYGTRLGSDFKFQIN